MSKHNEPAEQISSLAWLHRRRDKAGKPLISREEFEAGERLAGDFHAALLSPRVTASWSGAASSRRQRRGPPGHGVEISDYAIGAKQRFEQALQAVGREHGDLLIDVCCFERGLTEIEKTAGWPQRSGKLVLQMALRQLARHYGLIRDDSAPRSSRVRHWGAEGYRPDL